MQKRRPSILTSPLGQLGVLCFSMFIYGIATTFAAPPLGANSGSNSSACAGPEFEPMNGICICPRETVCVKNVRSLIFLTLARLSAYADYPLYALLFISKANNLLGFLQRTHLSEFFPLNDMHQLHTFAGKVVGVEVIWHSFWHILRWSLEGEMSFLTSHITGLTGLISLVLTPFIVWPMLFKTLKARLSFEVRKGLHYLSVVWGVVICFHAPARHIGIIMGIAVGIYGADWLYGYFFRVYRIPSLHFHRLGNAIEVTWENPPGFENHGAGYVYMCVPWVSKTEFHAFSVMGHRTRPNHSSVCISTVGDWSKNLHAQLAKPSHRPGWVYGPFPSPFSTAVDYDNLLAIATGIGITPSIAALVSLREVRAVNLIWMCRDADLIEFYMRDETIFHEKAWTFIFYTGKRKLLLDQRPKNARILIIHGRPQLEELLLSIIVNVITGAPLPDTLYERAREAEAVIYNISPLGVFCNAFERALISYTLDELFEIGLDESGPDSDGEPPTALSPPGFVAMVRTVCDLKDDVSDDLTDEQLRSYFDEVDTSGDGAVDREEFGAIVASLQRILNNERVPPPVRPKPKKLRAAGAALVERAASNIAEAATEVALVAGSVVMEMSSGVASHIKKTATQLRRTMDPIEGGLENWNVLYCGGSASVIAELRKFQRKFRVQFNMESFDW